MPKKKASAECWLSESQNDLELAMKITRINRRKCLEFTLASGMAWLTTPTVLNACSSTPTPSQPPGDPPLRTRNLTNKHDSKKGSPTAANIWLTASHVIYLNRAQDSIDRMSRDQGERAGIGQGAASFALVNGRVYIANGVGVTGTTTISSLDAFNNQDEQTHWDSGGVDDFTLYGSKTRVGWGNDKRAAYVLEGTNVKKLVNEATSRIALTDLGYVWATPASPAELKLTRFDGTTLALTQLEPGMPGAVVDVAGHLYLASKTGFVPLLEAKGKGPITYPKPYAGLAALRSNGNLLIWAQFEDSGGVGTSIWAMDVVRDTSPARLANGLRRVLEVDIDARGITWVEQDAAVLPGSTENETFVVTADFA
jgi:hypothetical protein